MSGELLIYLGNIKFCENGFQSVTFVIIIRYTFNIRNCKEWQSVFTFYIGIKPIPLQSLIINRATVLRCTQGVLGWETSNRHWYRVLFCCRSKSLTKSTVPLCIILWLCGKFDNVYVVELIVHWGITSLPRLCWQEKTANLSDPHVTSTSLGSAVNTVSVQCLWEK